MKTHLLDSSVPLVEGQDQIAGCGALIKQAAFVFMWDDLSCDGGDVTSAIFGQWNLCRKCKKIGEVKGRYIYGITDGENVKSRSRGEEEA